jgi:membrane peptidoglycan carboxypeptidase
VRHFGRFVKVTLVSGIAAALVLAVVVPVAAFAVASLGSRIELQPLAIRAVNAPSVVYDDCNPDPGPGQCGPQDVIAVLSNDDFSKPISSLSDIPAVVIKAVLDAEDKNFWYHGPIDLPGIVRAAEQDVAHHGIVQGGSTITQQLVKNQVLTPKRTFTRKITEVIDSYRLFNKMSRSQILLDYLNTVYFGEGAYGVQAAAGVYFGTTVENLDAGQAAYLAGLIRDPALGYPANAQAAEARRNEVIDAMVADHNLSPSITPAQAVFYKAEPVPTQVHPPAQQTYSPFVTEVVQYLLGDPALGATQALRYNELFKGGLQIYSTFNPALQADANQAVAKILPNTQGKFTAALVAMNPTNGYVEALVPGNPASNQGYDVATGYGGSGRQPGSSYKGIVMAAALENGFSPNDYVDGTSPCVFNMPYPQKPYVANNAEPGYGTITIQQALTDSVNCAFIRIGLAVGDARIASQAKAMGINDPLGINPSLPGSPTTPILPVPSIAIGSEVATPLEIASVYATIDDGGVYHTPVFVRKVYTSKLAGHQLLVDNTALKGRQVEPTIDAEIETQMLEQVIEYGTGTAAQLPGRPAAGKTGTTDSLVDAWFTGYTPQLVASVWMGDPLGEVPMYDVGGVDVYGGTYPAEIWRQFMMSALSGQPVIPFRTVPSGEIPPGGRYISCSSGTGPSGASGPTTCSLTGTATSDQNASSTTTGIFPPETTSTTGTTSTTVVGSSTTTQPSSTTTVTPTSSSTTRPVSTTVPASTTTSAG